MNSSSDTWHGRSYFAASAATALSIGVGPQGRGVMGNFLAQDDCRVVAVCDVAKRNLNQALGQVNEHYADHACATYHHYRELLERKDIDAVLIATGDRWQWLSGAWRGRCTSGG